MLYISLAVLAALLFALAEAIRDTSFLKETHAEPPSGSHVADEQWADRYLLIGWYGAWLAGGIAFLASYWYCIATYGYLLGFGLGWLPSGILAGIIWWVTRYVWPVFALGLVGAVVALAHS